MLNFRINSPDENQEQTKKEYRYDIGTRFIFKTIGGKLQASLSIPVLFA